MNSQEIRSQFSILTQRVNGHPLAYLDSASTTQKPQFVLDVMNDFYQSEYANVHRGLYALAEQASARYEAARTTVANFLGVADARQIVFTKGTTEGINLVASSFVASTLTTGDVIITTIMEHHSNFVPWQQLCQRVGAELRVVPLTDGGLLDLTLLESMLDERVKLLALTHVSNVLGVLNPVKEIVHLAHKQGVPVLLDAAQSVAHFPIDVTDLDVDFLVFSGHKLYGPTGIGVLYTKAELLERMLPYQYGGDMIESVTVERTTWNQIPHKFEAGTPNIVGAIGLAAAIEWLQSIGFDKISKYEHSTILYMLDELKRIDGLTILGSKNASLRTGLVSFTVDGIHPHDIASLADDDGVAIRAGYHCAEPLHRALGLRGSVRASLGVYSTKEDVDQLVVSLRFIQQRLG